MESKIKSKAFQKFMEAAETLLNPSIERWKKQGGKVVGYFCTHVPSEMIAAAGFLPFRMRGTGSTGTERSDAYFGSINCSFPRHCFNIALEGGFGFMDGLVVINSCDHVRRIYDNWKRGIDSGFLYMMSLPRKTGEPQIDYFRDEIVLFKNAMEKQFNVEITDECLWNAIGAHNETRRLQKLIYELRKGDRPPITGAETLAMMVAGTCMPREEYNALLKELLDEMRSSEGNGEYRARLMIVGGILDDPEYVRTIEDQGGLVVTDSICFGSRMMWEEVEERAGDPCMALAKYYIAERPSCPRMYGDQPRRAEFIRNMVQEFKVDGVIGERLLFCDQWVVEHYMNSLDLKELGIPFLQVDREYIMSGKGQLRTRVQAFLESMGR